MAQVFVNGLLLGADLALLALGYTLVFGVMRLLTLAHGEVFMASGLGALLLASSDTPIWLAGLAALVFGAVLGMLTDLLCFRPVGYDQPIAAAVATIGFAIVIMNATIQLRGSSTPVALPFDLPDLDWEVGMVLVSATQAASFLIAIFLMVAIRLFVDRTRWGVAMRGLSSDPDMVAALGVPVRKLILVTMAIAGGLAGVASFLLALRNGSLSPFGGVETGLIGLAVMTIGGLGSLNGAMVAGVSLGLATTLASYWGLEGWQSAVPWALLIVTLMIRPRGLLPVRADA